MPYLEEEYKSEDDNVEFDSDDEKTFMKEYYKNISISEIAKKKQNKKKKNKSTKSDEEKISPNIEEEYKKLVSLREKFNYELQKDPKDKTLIKIDIKTSNTAHSASDESVVGLKEGLSNEDALKFIKKEYRKWNGRLTTLSPGNERDNAQRLLDQLATLRKK